MELPRPFPVRSLPVLVAGLLATAVIVFGWRGSDWPAQLYRADLFARAGFTQWHNQWYGGHHTPGYSLLFPPLGAVLGVAVVAVISSVAASWAFTALANALLPPRAALVSSVWFAVGTATNVAVGRVTFALGLALAVFAVGAMLRSAPWAVVVAIVAPLASPVAGVFVAIAATALLLSSRADRDRRRLAVAMTAGALAPIAVLGAAFPEGGRFPFRFGHFVAVLVSCALVGLLAPRAWTAVRVGSLLYAAIATAVFVVPNPLGGNVARLAMFFGGPLLAGMLWPQRKKLLIVFGMAMVVWQWQPAFDAVANAGRDPSTKAAYYQPLIDFVEQDPFARIEIPFTRRHWESHFVARHVALARGWQRQLDIEVNSLFYAPDALNESSYKRWLSDNAISYVALPDAELDESAIAEASLLRAGIEGLVPVWRNEHWQVWRVTDTEPLVEGPARLVELDADEFTLQADDPGDVLIRIRYSSHWDIDGPGCLVESPDGWTLLRDADRGARASEASGFALAPVPTPTRRRMPDDLARLTRRHGRACGGLVASRRAPHSRHVGPLVEWGRNSRRGGAMQHARIALYDLTSGSFDEVATLAERDLLRVFQQQPGFRAYGLTRVDHVSLISISLWATEAQAYASAETAAAWVRDHIEDRVKLRSTHIGEMAFWSADAPNEYAGTQTPIPT